MTHETLNDIATHEVVARELDAASNRQIVTVKACVVIRNPHSIL
jgi:hypothetical protein